MFDAVPAAPQRPLLFGLDLGKVQDYSALAVAEQAEANGRRAYHVRHLHRWPLGTPYTADQGRGGIVGDVRQMLRQAPGRAVLVLDATGCGRPVADAFESCRPRATTLAPVVITGGHKASRSGGYLHVPKKELVGAVAVCLESRRLHIAPGLRLAAVLSRELQTFKVKLTAAGNETFATWRERDHDDLVLATALALWYGEAMDCSDWSIRVVNSREPGTGLPRAERLRYPSLRWVGSCAGYQPLPAYRGEPQPGAPAFPAQEEAAAFLHLFAERLGLEPPSIEMPDLSPRQRSGVEAKLNEFLRQKRLPR